MNIQSDQTRIKIRGTSLFKKIYLPVLFLAVLVCASCSSTGETNSSPDQSQITPTLTMEGTQPSATLTPTIQPPSPTSTTSQSSEAILLRFPAIRQACRLVDSGATYQGEPILQTTDDCWPNEQQNDTLWGLAVDDTGTPIPVNLLDPAEGAYDEVLVGLLPGGAVIHLAYGNPSGAFAVNDFQDYAHHPTQYSLLGLSYQGRSILVIISIAIEPPLPTTTP